MESLNTDSILEHFLNAKRPTGADDFKGAEAPSGRRSDRPTTIGRYLLDQALPEQYRDSQRVWDSKTAGQLFATLAQEQPEQYNDILFQLAQIAKEAQSSRGGVSPSIRPS